jgi:hypothetical protein
LTSGEILLKAVKKDQAIHIAAKENLQSPIGCELAMRRAPGRHPSFH